MPDESIAALEQRRARLCRQLAPIGEMRSGSVRGFRARGLCVSSGVVEAGCKRVVGARLKRAGMRWTVVGASAVIALRCCRPSGRFEDFRERRAAHAA